jgi:hypothetical protein
MDAADGRVGVIVTANCVTRAPHPNAEDPSEVSHRLTWQQPLLCSGELVHDQFIVNRRSGSHARHRHSRRYPATVLGVLSLIVWTLIAITSIKYVTIAMRVDNDGEGGILALMALLGVKRQRRPAIVALGLFGAALIYGEGAITPAISVLSALEGLTIAAPGLGP